MVLGSNILLNINSINGTSRCVLLSFLFLSEFQYKSLCFVESVQRLFLSYILKQVVDLLLNTYKVKITLSKCDNIYKVHTQYSTKQEYNVTRCRLSTHTLFYVLG